MHASWEELSSLPVAYVRLSPQGQFLQVNKAACEFFGYTEEQLLGLTARDLTHPEDRAQSVVLVDRAVRHREESHQVIKRYIHQQGHALWALLSTVLERDDDGNPKGWLSRIEDITARVAPRPSQPFDFAGHKATPLESDDVLRAFVRRIQTVKEQERQGIARELHEELGQTFAGLKLELDKLQATLPPEGRAQARRLSSVIDDALGSVRRFTAALRPPILDDLGLESALEWLLSRVCERAGLAWSFPRTGKPLSLDWETRIALFRIAQEGLKHLLRESKAKRVEVRLTQDGDWVVLRMIDDGKGPGSAAQLAKSLEICIMRERAQMLGGNVTLRANKPGGTFMEARLRAPLENAPGRELRAHWE